MEKCSINSVRDVSELEHWPEGLFCHSFHSIKWKVNFRTHFLEHSMRSSGHPSDYGDPEMTWREIF